MKIVDQFYTTRNLYRNGIFILICLVGATIFSWFIPEFKIEKQDKQLFSIDGLYIKHGNTQMVSHYFNSIKNNNGVLILGTSETGRYPEGNYFDYLNNDPDLKEYQFSVIGGAGRTCGIHIPTFLKHKKDLKGLRMIYFINPIYWRTELAHMQPKYWDRDHNYMKLSELKITPEERKKYWKPVQAYLDYLGTKDKTLFYSEQLVHDVREKYYQDLNFNLNPEEYYNELVYLDPNEGDLDQFKLFGKIDHKAIDTSWAVSYEYFAGKAYDGIDVKATYRYEELEAFTRLCDDLNLDITFIVGPYNKRYVEKHESSAEFEKVLKKIKVILNKNNAKIIDASGISDKAGAFQDLQHHSNYGGYLIYQIIKSEYCEN